MTEPPREGSVVAIPGDGRGEIAQYGPDGRFLARWTGFSDIGRLALPGSGRLAVFDKGNYRFVELDRAGSVLRTLPLKSKVVYDGTVLPNGHLLLAAGRDGAVELDSFGNVVWEAAAEGRGADVVAAVRLADGTTLCAARFSGAPLYEAPPGRRLLTPLAVAGVPPFTETWQWPRLKVLDPASSGVALSYEPWEKWYRLEWRKGSLPLPSIVPARAGVRAIAAGGGGVTWLAASAFEVVRLSASGAETARLLIGDEIRDIAAGEDGSVFVAVERKPDAERPAHRPPSPGHVPFSWSGLAAWVAAALLAIGFLQVMTWRNAAGEEAPPASPAGGGWWERTRTASFPRWLRLPTACTVAALLVGGLVLWRWRSLDSHENASVSLWVFLQILCVGLLALSPRRRRLRERRISPETLLHVAALLLIGAIVLSIDLDGVPKNVHNDVGLTVDFAMRLLEGRADRFFSSGYAEIPYPGHLPTSLGLLVAGVTVAGSRVGGLLMGLVAVLGAYALGREYKSARLGLFAGLLLLASVPFVHFSRSTPFGEVAAYSVWLLYLLLRAVRTAHPGAWLVFGVAGGWGLFLFYSARVALLGVIVAGILLALRSLRVTLRRWYGPLLFALGFAVTVVPMVPYWRAHPAAFSHRMDTSFALYDPATGFHGKVLARAVGKPFVKTLGMFYTERDISGQGTLSPAEGPIEAALLTVGLAVVLLDGWGANIACLGWFVVMLLGCGVFTETTPWYTRLMPVTPVVSLFIARALDCALDALAMKRAAAKRLATAAVAAALIGLSAWNVRAYLAYERRRLPTEFTAFGRAALALGPRYQFYCLTYQRPDFRCQHGSFVPYLANLDVRDVHDPDRLMPFPPGRPAAVMIPFELFRPHPRDPKAIVDEIVRRYPAARLEYVRRRSTGADPPIGVLALVSPERGSR